MLLHKTIFKFYFSHALTHLQSSIPKSKPVISPTRHGKADITVTVILTHLTILGKACFQPNDCAESIPITLQSIIHQYAMLFSIVSQMDCYGLGIAKSSLKSLNTKLYSLLSHHSLAMRAYCILSFNKWLRCSGSAHVQ